MSKSKAKKMAKNTKKAGGGHEILTNENFRIQVDEIIRDFVNDPLQVQFDFPPDLTKEMRGYIHSKCSRIGIKSHSKGSKNNRSLSLYKKPATSKAESVQLTLSPDTVQLLHQVHELPVLRNIAYDFETVQWDSMNKLFKWQVTRAVPPNLSQHTAFRKTLPIYQSRSLILNAIRSNQVVFVNAETGSGKTTQLPQYIIEEAAARNEHVRVICTQPRRLSTIAVATRVAEERNEVLGNTVGYQIKLESKIGQETAIIFCTNGILLRTLMGGDSCFNNITHVIVDEIHERDKYTDFLLIILRQALARFKHLRLILMSATMDIDPFVKYFEPIVPMVLNIEGRSFCCVSWFLSDVLQQLNYESARMRKLRQLRERSDFLPAPRVKPRSEQYAELDNAAKMELNEIIASCFDAGRDDDFNELLQMFLNENVNPNYQDWTGKTALMAACRHGKMRFVEQLLNLGADMFLSSTEGVTASGWAQQANHMDVINLLTMYEVVIPGAELAAPPTSLLSTYLRTVNDDFVDHELILELIKHIHYSLGDEGAILVFLPGYEDIMTCNEHVLASNLPADKYKLIMLHGSMQMQAQRDVFKKYPGRQKIILSTNIAETSITIDDVRFVIDSGRAKIKTYDARTGISHLKSDWISMANSRQRAGRAGRTQNGYCFHLYSIARYESFYVHPIPEILRTPLHELCLQTKILAQGAMSIAEFLGLAVNPPLTIAIQEAIKTLKCLGALDESENMTPLGSHLVQFSIEPRLGKILLFGVVLKCLDPVLTLVATMTQKDPFVLPAQGDLKQLALEKRKQLAEESLSDHMIFLRAFQLWQENKVVNRGYQFCNNYFMSPAVMELTTQTRSQLLSQLRAMGFVQSYPKEAITELNQFANDWPMVKCCLAAGLYPNVALYNSHPLHNKLEKIGICSQSSLKGSAFEVKGNAAIKDAWMIYDEVSKPRAKATIKSGTVITPITVAIICGQNTQLTDETILMDETYAFETEHPQVMFLRNNIGNIFYKKITAPHLFLTSEEQQVLHIFAKILQSEEERFEICAPTDIGKRPVITHLTIKQSKLDSSPRDKRPPTDRSYQNSHSSTYYNQQSRSFENGPQDNWRISSAKRGNHGRGMEDAAANSKFFVVRPVETKYMKIAIQQRLWRFAPHTERDIEHLFAERNEIYLLFHVQYSHEIQGLAKLLDTNNGIPNKPCPIEWISTNRIPIFRIRHVLPRNMNQFNESFQVTSSVGFQISKLICDQNHRTMPHGPTDDSCTGMNQYSRPGHSRTSYQ